MPEPLHAAPLFQIVELFTAATILVKAAGKMAAALEKTLQQFLKLKEVVFS